MENKRLWLLDLFRIGIIYLILLFHMAIHFGFSTPLRFVNKFIGSGAFAMTCFFMLSGALISYLYSDNNFAEGENLLKFYKKRIAKMYPLYIIVLILLYILFMFPEPVKWWVIPMQIIPLQAFFPKSFFEFFNGGCWFISALFFAYFLFPLLNSVLNKFNNHLMKVFLTVWLLLIYFFAVDVYQSSELGLYISPIIRTMEFFLGMVSAQIAKKYPREKNMLRFFGLSIIMLFVSTAGLSHTNFLNHVRFGHIYVYMDLFVCPITALIIYTAMNIDNCKLPKLFKLKIWEYLSNIGYAFFLGQLFIIFWGIKHKEIIGTLSSTEIWLYSTILNLIIAVMLYELFQKRLLVLLVNKIMKKQV